MMVKIRSLLMLSLLTAPVVVLVPAYAEPAAGSTPTITSNGFEAKTSNQYPSFAEFGGTATYDKKPVGDATLRCGLTAGGDEYPGYKSFFVQSKANPQILLDVRIVDGTIIASTRSDTGNIAGRPLTVQTLGLKDQQTVNFCDYDPTTDTMSRCLPNQAAFLTKDQMRSIGATVTSYCKTLVARVSKRMTHKTDDSREANWQQYRNAQTQLLNTLGQ